VALALVAASEAFSFSASSSLTPSALARPSICGFQRPLELRAGLRLSPIGLRMSNSPSVDSNDEVVEENDEEGSTVMSDEDLDARIKSLGLGEESGVEDKSSGEEEQLTPMQQAQKQAVKVGTTIIGGAASGAISVLNQIEQPIEEDEWKKIQGTQEKGLQPAPDQPEEKTMINAGGLAVVVPVALVGGALAFWAVASENDWF